MEKLYEADLGDGAWAPVEPHLPAAMPGGRPSCSRARRVPDDRDYGRPARNKRGSARGFDGHKKLTNWAGHLVILAARSVDISTHWQGIIVTGMNVISIETFLDASGDRKDTFAVTQLTRLDHMREPQIRSATVIMEAGA